VTPPTGDAGNACDVLILGGGFAGVYAAKRLEKVLPRDARITLVNNENYFVFQPLLAEVVGASLEPTHVISPLRHMLKHTRVVRGTVLAIEPDPRRVEICELESGKCTWLEGQHIVLALGSIVDASKTPGMAEHALLMKNLADALRLRQAVVSRLERAVLEPDAAEREALLTFVVVGGGFSGVETAAEMLDLVKGSIRYYPRLEAVPLRVIVVEGRDHVLGELDRELGNFARKLLEKRGMQFRLETRTKAVSADSVYLTSGEVIRARTVVCTIGNAPHPAITSLSLSCERGRIVTDEHLRVTGHERIWAIGDCACNPDGYGKVSPPTAQFAVRQGTCAADNIARALRGEALRPFRHRSQGQLATLGHLNAVAQIGPFRISGFLAWWLWRTTYLLKLPRFERKLRVVIDWTLRLFFPRDLTVVDVKPTTGLTHIHLEEGETLFTQGDPSAAFYVVESGSIELVQRDAQGEVVLREVLGKGAHFGEGSLLGNRIRRTTATALASTSVISFYAKDFDELLTHFTAFRAMLERTSSRFREASELLPSELSTSELARPVEEIMASPAITLPSTATLREGLAEMARRPFGCWPIVDESGRLCAIAALSDLQRSLRSSIPLDEALIKFATPRVQTVGPHEPLSRCIELMRRHAIKHLPVVDHEHRPIGMVSLRDLVRHLLGTVAAR
jgi:NADH dehydrogenase